MKTMKFADNLEKKVFLFECNTIFNNFFFQNLSLKKIDMKKIQLEIMKPFITGKLNAMMPVEDEVIIEYVFSQLEQSQVGQYVCDIAAVICL